MKILVVHQYYLPPGQPGGSRFNEMVGFWEQAGHQVTVIAGTVNYVTGEVFEGYRGRWVSKGVEGSTTVWRCHVPSAYSRSYVGRTWAFLAFTLSSIVAALTTDRPDVVIASSPPLVAAIPGWVAARCRVRRVPWIFEVRDLWPESAVTTGVLKERSVLTRLLYALERWACSTADRVTVLTPAFRDNLTSRGLVADEKVVFVPNGADLDMFRPLSDGTPVRRAFGWGDRLVVLYAGAHGRANAVGQLVEAADRLKHRRDILIATIGDGPERRRWEEEAQRRDLTNIVFLGAYPRERIPDLVGACDVGAAVLQNNRTFRTVYPNKVFDYMAAGRPILLAIDGAARKLVCDEARAGVFAEPENPDAIASAIRGLADNPAGRAEMGKNGRRWVETHASRASLAAKYLAVMHVLAAGHRQSDPATRSRKTRPSVTL